MSGDAQVELVDADFFVLVDEIDARVEGKLFLVSELLQHRVYDGVKETLISHIKIVTANPSSCAVC